MLKAVLLSPSTRFFSQFTTILILLNNIPKTESQNLDPIIFSVVEALHTRETEAVVQPLAEPEKTRTNNNQPKSCISYQGRNEVYGIRDQRPKKGWDQGSQPRIRDHSPRDRDQRVCH